MSPALTAHSVFSAASSLPPSASCLPPPHILQNVNPTDFFSPLGSPAITPQNFQLPVLPGSSNYPTTYPQSQSQPQSQPHSRSQSLSVAQGQTMSPQLLATDVGGDAGMSTAAGSGRRGAGANKKSRPSPLLKPTPDANLRRKKLPNEKRSSSSSGMRSVTTSPFLGPSTFSMTSSNSMHSSSVPSSSRTSPQEVGESDNTPSPVDLAVSDVVSTSNQIPIQQQHLQQSPYSMASTSYLPEFMGPPPPPSSNPPSRRSSMNPANSNSISSDGAWNPVTPATLMNFASDLADAGLSNLTYPHHLQHHQDQQQQQQQQLHQQHQLSQSLSQDLNSNYQYDPRNLQVDDSVNHLVVDPRMTKAQAKKAATAAARAGMNGMNGNAVNGGTGATKGKGKAAMAKNIKVNGATRSKANGE